MNLDYIDHRFTRNMLIPAINKLPQRFRPHVIAQHKKTYLQPRTKNHDSYNNPQRNANAAVLQLLEGMKGGAYRLAASEQELRDYADAKAHAGRLAGAAGGYKMAAQHARMANIEPPEITDKMTEEGATARLGCPSWWRRAVRVTQGRHIEKSAIGLGIVHKNAELYASEETRARRTEQKSKNRKMLEAVQVVNEMGDEYTLQELADLSVSNPVIRRAELITRCVGFENIAQQENHAAVFYTIH